MRPTSGRPSLALVDLPAGAAAKRVELGVDLATQVVEPRTDQRLDRQRLRLAETVATQLQLDRAVEYARSHCGNIGRVVGFQRAGAGIGLRAHEQRVDREAEPPLARFDQRHAGKTEILQRVLEADVQVRLDARHLGVAVQPRGPEVRGGGDRPAVLWRSGSCASVGAAIVIVPHRIKRSTRVMVRQSPRASRSS